MGVSIVILGFKKALLPSPVSIQTAYFYCYIICDILASIPIFSTFEYWVKSLLPLSSDGTAVRVLGELVTPTQCQGRFPEEVTSDLRLKN